MIYEWRVYQIVPGKRRTLNERFANHALRLFEKHGISVVGFWESLVGGSTNTLYYMLAFESLDDMEKSWGRFHADPEWQEVVRESEKDGPLIGSITNMVLRPAAYSPMR